MPGRDGTGPSGQGPLTGGGFGPCGAYRSVGRGAGMRMSGRGFGRGMGRGIGRGMGMGPGYWTAPAPAPSPEEEKAFLQDEIKRIQQRIDELS